MATITEIKKCCLFLSVAVLAAPVSALIPTRYYVGKTEVTESFWNSMPNNLDYVTCDFNYDSLVVKSRELPFTHYLDSVSSPGEYVLCKRRPEEIAEIERAYAMTTKVRREQSLSASIEEQAPQISLIRYKTGSVIDNLILPGHCYLLSFWATWCGNCLLELKPEFIPSVVEKFNDNQCFHFIPICIDSTTDDLKKFFSGQTGRRWSYLADITYLDPNRKANNQYGESGIMPLNVVVGKDGLIRYIHSGVIKDNAELSTLYEAIESGILQEPQTCK